MARSRRWNSNAAALQECQARSAALQGVASGWPPAGRSPFPGQAQSDLAACKQTAARDRGAPGEPRRTASSGNRGTSRRAPRPVRRPWRSRWVRGGRVRRRPRPAVQLRGAPPLGQKQGELNAGAKQLAEAMARVQACTASLGQQTSSPASCTTSSAAGRHRPAAPPLATQRDQAAACTQDIEGAQSKLASFRPGEVRVTPRAWPRPRAQLAERTRELAERTAALFVSPGTPRNAGEPGARILWGCRE